MKKKLILVAVSMFFCVTMTGCWNYRGINELDIVTGVAIDWNELGGAYELTFEIADVASATPDDTRKTKYVESEGETIPDAVKNAQKRLTNNLYFGNMQALILGGELIEKYGVMSIIEFFMRDVELRETLSVVVSKNCTAKELICAEGIDSHIVAYEIKRVITEDSKFTTSTVSVAMYQAYGLLKETGKVLALPAFHTVTNNEVVTPEAHGIALFSEDRILAFLPPENAKYYLFITDKIEGGILSFEPEGDESGSIALEVERSQTKVDYEYTHEALKITINIDTNVNAVSIKSRLNAIQSKEEQELEAEAEAVLKERVIQLIEKAQNEYKADIFGFGSMIYKNDPELWRALEDKWDTVFSSAEFEVQTQIRIQHTGVMSEY